MELSNITNKYIATYFEQSIPYYEFSKEVMEEDICDREISKIKSEGVTKEDYNNIKKRVLSDLKELLNIDKDIYLVILEAKLKNIKSSFAKNNELLDSIIKRIHERGKERIIGAWRVSKDLSSYYSKGYEFASIVEELSNRHINNIANQYEQDAKTLSILMTEKKNKIYSNFHKYEQMYSENVSESIKKQMPIWQTENLTLQEINEKISKIKDEESLRIEMYKSENNGWISMMRSIEDATVSPTFDKSKKKINLVISDRLKKYLDLQEILYNIYVDTISTLINVDEHLTTKEKNVIRAMEIWQEASYYDRESLEDKFGMQNASKRPTKSELAIEEDTYNIYIDNVINGENIEEPNYNKELLEEKPEKQKRVRKATVEDILAKIEKERSSKKM